MSNVFEYTDYEPLASSVLSGAYYNKDSKKLYVLLNNGAIAGYNNVPHPVWLELINSESAGGYWARTIRGKFQGLNGDVRFKRKEQAETQVGTPGTFIVKASLSGSVEFQVTAESIVEAVEKFNNFFSDQPKLKVTVEGVNIDERVQNPR